MIRRAAIMRHGIVYVGLKGDRHDTVFETNREMLLPWDDGKMGFVTDTGEFVSRKQAATHAHECGQMSEDVGHLFSEDLW